MERECGACRWASCSVTLGCILGVHGCYFSLFLLFGKWKETGRDRENFQGQIHFPDSHQSWEPRTPAGSCTWVARNQVFEPSPVAPWALHSQQAGAKIQSWHSDPGRGEAALSKHWLPPSKERPEGCGGWPSWFRLCLPPAPAAAACPQAELSATVLYCFVAERWRGGMELLFSGSVPNCTLPTGPGAVRSCKLRTHAWSP